MDETVHLARSENLPTTTRSGRARGTARQSATSTAQSGPKAAAQRERTRTNDPERTKAEILAVAKAEFAEKGLDGARIDEIAAATRTSKRMIYYYFGSKEGLYVAVLEAAYRETREAEAELRLDDFTQEDALRKLVGRAFDRCMQNQWYVRLVANENIQRGKYIAESKAIQQLNVPVIDTIRRLYERGVRQGSFRSGIDAVDLHASISALTFFNVSNQHTFGCIFQIDWQNVQTITARRDSIIEMIVRFVRK